MRNFIMAALLISVPLAALAKGKVSTLPVKDPNGNRAQMRITWGEDSIEAISLLDAKGKEYASLDPGGDWTNLGAENDHGRKDIVKAEDANFDGLVDLLIEQSTGSAGQLFKLFRYDGGKKKYVRSDALDEVWNPTFDPKQKLVKGGAADARVQTYRWDGLDKLKPQP